MVTNEMKMGVLLPTRGLIMAEQGGEDTEVILRMAEVAEAAGLDSVWVGDSLTAKPRLEPLTTLAAVAARTRHVRLGTAVLLAAMRHPVLLAHIVGTLDMISKGRLVLAVGVGGSFNEEQRGEWRAAGVRPSARSGRLEELLEIVKRLGVGESLSFSGMHFSLDSVAVSPRPIQPGGVPVLLAAHWRVGKEAQLRRVARLGDGLISISDSPEEYARLLKKVRMYVNEEGKDFQKMESAFYITVNLEKDQKRAREEAERYLLMYYGKNIWGDRWGPFGHPQLTIDRIGQYYKAGVGTFVVRFASFDQEGQLDTFLREVLPAVRGMTDPLGSCS